VDVTRITSEGSKTRYARQLHGDEEEQARAPSKAYAATVTFVSCSPPSNTPRRSRFESVFSRQVSGER
jgi:hypothetical protein